MITKSDLKEFSRLTRAACYNPEEKEKYKKLGRKILKYIAKELALTKGTYEIRWNPGGIACSGDHVLHHEIFYLNLSDNVGFGSFYHRSCNGLKDYFGGNNNNIEFKTLEKRGIYYLINDLWRNYLINLKPSEYQKYCLVN